MNYIKLYESFLNERMGVPDAIQPYLDPIADYVIGQIEHLIKSGQFLTAINSTGLTLEKTLEEKPFPEFPIKKVELVVDFNVIKSNENPIIVNGGSGKMSKEADGFVCFLELNPMVDVKKIIEVFSGKNNKFLDEIREEIRSVIAHEFTHIYEMYMRRKNKKALNGTEHALFAFTANKIAHLDLPSSIASLFHLMYVQAEHELSARIPQVQSLIRNVEDPHKREQIILKSQPFKQAQELIDFDAQKFYDYQIEKISKLMDGDKEGAKKKLDILFKQLEENFDTGKKIMLSNLKDILDPEEIEDVEKALNSHEKDIQKIQRMDALKFFKFWERRFNEAGKKLKTKLLKLATY